jgi:hypothetical protein
MVLNEVSLIMRNGFICLIIGLVAKACEHGNESSRSITIGNYFTGWATGSFVRMPLLLTETRRNRTAYFAFHLFAAVSVSNCLFSVIVCRLRALSQVSAYFKCRTSIDRGNANFTFFTFLFVSKLREWSFLASVFFGLSKFALLSYWFPSVIN